MSDASAALLRAIRAALPPTNAFVLEKLRSSYWASATFAGMRHTLAFRLEGDGAAAAAADFLDGLGEREFDLRGHFIADIAACPESRPQVGRIALEALTMEHG